ncbi:MAG TPA: tetratricopeptide repeat protein [Bauldia sp.]|nr:tetratricopeptide repeat protein [Bauldia sp.]
MRISHRLRLTLATAAVLMPGVALAAIDLPPTFSGSYLAGRSAEGARDIGSAVKFYTAALRADPDNPSLSDRLLLLSLANDDMDEAFHIAERLVEIDPTNPGARLALAARALKQGKSAEAADVIAKTAPAELATITSGLVTAWIEFGNGKVDDAVKTIDALSGPEWYKVFKDFHTALILDAAGRTSDAVNAIKSAYGDDGSALRIVVAYARILSRAGQRDEAIRALTAYGGEDPRHPELRYILADLKDGKDLPPLATTANAGAAEALYGLGAAIGVDDGPELPAAYLRLSAYLDARDSLAVEAIGDVFQSIDRCQDAIPLYDKVPRSAPIRRNADIQTASCLASLDKPDEGAKLIERVLASDPKDIEAAIELGNIYRASDRYADAAAAYSRGIAAIGEPDKADWRIFYYRGVALERSKRWPEAEADFKQALKLNPDQPQVLNYLGYSWVDRGENLDEALDMIKKAVSLSPNDGYIVDSLGWAYHRLKRDGEAVTTLESAIELKGGDATINDHLGDVYWSVGRKREAYFQWAHARDSEPEKEDLPKILHKLEHGLDGAAATEPVGPSGTPIQVGKGDSLWTIATRVFGDGEQYIRLIEANRDRIGRDPDKIYPGMTLDMPDSVN